MRLQNQLNIFLSSMSFANNYFGSVITTDRYIASNFPINRIKYASKLSVFIVNHEKHYRIIIIYTYILYDTITSEK
jgi:hypothetical protein